MRHILPQARIHKLRSPAVFMTFSFKGSEPRRSPARWPRALAASLSLMLATAATAAQAALVDSGWVPTATEAHPVSALVPRGLMASGESLHVVLSLNMRDAEGLDRFNSEVTRPDSPAYEQWLSPQQFLDRHAPSQAQVKAVVDHLVRAGFINIEVAPNRLLVSADGSAGVVRNAFHTELAHFEVDGRSAYANTQPAQVPKALAGIVQSVLGLQDVHLLHSLARFAEVQPGAEQSGPVQAVAQAAHGFNPRDFQTAYGVDNTPDAGITTVGIITEADQTQTLADLRQYEKANGLAAVLATVVNLHLPNKQDPANEVEWALDSQTIRGVAGAKLGHLVFYSAYSFRGADLTSAFNRAVTDHIAKVISVSIGGDESNAKADGSAAADDRIFASAIAQGQTFVASSGDRAPVHIDYPGSSPNVVAAGGSRLLVNADGSYASESAWSHGGGGPSTIEKKPAYQNGVVPGTQRGVPDIALDADPNTGAIIISAGKSKQVGGTSLSAPLFAGLYARIESATGNKRGFPNPFFYKNIPTNSSLFHDITSGTNGGYKAGPGWDYASGFGSPIESNLLAFVRANPGF